MGSNNSKPSLTVPVPTPTTWTSKYKVGDHLILTYSNSDFPNIIVIDKIYPNNMDHHYLTSVIYDDVAYDKIGQDSKTNYQFKHPDSCGQNPNILRNTTDQELISGKVNRVKGEKCEVWINENEYEYKWVAGKIVLVSQKNKKIYINTKNNKVYSVPIKSLNVAPLYTHTKKEKEEPIIASLPPVIVPSMSSTPTTTPIPSSIQLANALPPSYSSAMSQTADAVPLH